MQRNIQLLPLRPYNQSAIETQRTTRSKRPLVEVPAEGVPSRKRSKVGHLAAAVWGAVGGGGSGTPALALWLHVATTNERRHCPL